MKNCTNCKFKIDANTKFCPECGIKQEDACPTCNEKLIQGVKFCSDCGTKIIDLTLDEKSLAKELVRINFDATPTGLSNFTTKITSIVAEGPDTENQYNITVTYVIENNSTLNWAHLHQTVQIFTGSGKIIDESTSKSDELIEVGENKSISINFWSVSKNLFDGSIENIHAVVFITASKITQKIIPIKKLPSEIGDPVLFDNIEIFGKSKTVSGHINRVRSEDDPDDDSLEFKLCVQNISLNYQPVVWVKLIVNGINEEILLRIKYETEIMPGDIRLISFSGYINREAWNTAKIESTLAVLEPAASSLSQLKGCTVIASEGHTDEDEDEDADADEDENDEISESEFSSDIVIRLVMKKGDGEWPLKSELSDQEIRDLRNIAKLLISWNKDEYEELETAEIQDIEIIYDGVSHSKNLNWGIYLEGDEILGYPCPVIRFKISEKVPVDIFLRSIWESSISLKPTIRDVTDKEAFYCEDHNGYSSIIEGDDLLKLIEDLRSDKTLLNRKLNYTNLDDGIHLKALYDINSNNSVKTEKLNKCVDSNSPNIEPKKLENIFNEIKKIAPKIKFFTQPTIPEKKLKSAIQSYAQDVRPDDVIMLFDSTVFGGGKEGVLFSKTMIYAKDLARPIKSLKISEINNIYYKDSTFPPNIWINDQPFVQVNISDKDVIIKILNYVQEWADLLNLSAN